MARRAWMHSICSRAPRRSLLLKCSPRDFYKLCDGRAIRETCHRILSRYPNNLKTVAAISKAADIADARGALVVSSLRFRPSDYILASYLHPLALPVST
jgi:hypothetical protein